MRSSRRSLIRSKTPSRCTTPASTCSAPKSRTNRSRRRSKRSANRTLAETLSAPRPRKYAQKETGVADVTPVCSVASGSRREPRFASDRSYSGRARVQLIGGPELHARDVHLRDNALVREVVDRDAVVELGDSSRALLAGRGLRRGSRAPRALDELVVDLLVLEQQHEPVLLEPRAKTDAALAHVHVHGL